MLPKYIAQIVVAGATALGRALNRAIREELKTGRQAANRQAEKSDDGGSSSSSNASTTRKRTAANLRHSMTLQEAVQILHVADKLDVNEIEEKFQHLYTTNEKQKGGSFYLQEKIKSAKERIDDELRLRGDLPPRDSEKSNASEKSPPSDSSP